MRMGLIGAALVPLMLAAMPAKAQDASASYTLINAGDYDRAEHKLLAQLHNYPDSPELMLNLAAVYAKTNRVSEARALYNEVLAQRDVEMEISKNQVAGSHAIARTGLQQVTAVQFTAR